MSYSAFVALCELLDPLLHWQHTKSRSDEPITTIIIVATSLRILAGRKQANQKHIFGLSRAAVHHALNCFVDVVSRTTELDINWPKTPEEWEHARRGFKSKSYNKLFNGCIGAIDGFCKKLFAQQKRGIR